MTQGCVKPPENTPISHNRHCYIIAKGHTRGGLLHDVSVTLFFQIVKLYILSEVLFEKYFLNFLLTKKPNKISHFFRAENAPV